MAIFDRLRRNKNASTVSNNARAHKDGAIVADHAAESESGDAPRLRFPLVNQPVTVAHGLYMPVPSRVEDIGAQELVLAAPSLSLGMGDRVTVSWESAGVVSSLDAPVIMVDRKAAVPIIKLAVQGGVAQYQEREIPAQVVVELPIQLRILSARALRPGTELQTRTTQIGGESITFGSTASFAVGDIIEARISLGNAQDESIGARIKVTRVETRRGALRDSITAIYDEILRSDRSRLTLLSEQLGKGTASTPPTVDGVGGRDEPMPLSTFDNVVDWIRNREQN